MRKSTRKTQATVDQQTPAEDALERRLGDLVQKGVDADGEVDLRNLNADEIQRWMGAFGVPLMPGVSRVGIESLPAYPGPTR